MEWWKLLINIINHRNLVTTVQASPTALIEGNLWKEKINYRILVNKSKISKKKIIRSLRKILLINKNSFKLANQIKTKKSVIKEWKILVNVNIFINFGQKSLNRLWLTLLFIIWRIVASNEISKLIKLLLYVFLYF